MYVIHDSLVGVETVTFAYIRARVVIRMCFPASFIEYLWASFPLPPLLHMSFLDLVSCSVSFKLWKGWQARGRLLLLSRHRVPGWLSGCSLSLILCHAHAATASAMWEGRWRQKAAPLHRCGLRSTSGQAAADSSLAGKQGDFKVVATPEQAWKHHRQQMTG